MQFKGGGPAVQPTNHFIAVMELWSRTSASKEAKQLTAEDPPKLEDSEPTKYDEIVDGGAASDGDASAAEIEGLSAIEQWK